MNIKISTKISINIFHDFTGIMKKKSIYKINKNNKTDNVSNNKLNLISRFF